MRHAQVLSAALLTFAAIGAVSVDASAAWQAVGAIHPSALTYGPNAPFYYALVGSSVVEFDIYQSVANGQWGVCSNASNVVELACGDDSCNNLWLAQYQGGNWSLRSCNPNNNAWNGPAVSFSGGPSLTFGIRQMAGDGTGGIYVVEGAPVPNCKLWHWDGTHGWTSTLPWGVSSIAVTSSGSLFFTEDGQSQYRWLYDASGANTGAAVAGASVWSGLAAERVEGLDWGLWYPTWGEYEPKLPSGNNIVAFTSDGVPGSNSWGALALDTAGTLYQDSSECFPGPCDPNTVPNYGHFIEQVP